MLSGDTPPEQTPFQSWIHTNQGIGVALTVCLGIYLVVLELSPWVHERLRDGFTLGFFPVAGVVLMLVCTLTLVIDRHRKERIQELEAMKWGWFFFCILVSVASGIYFYLVLEIGYLLVSPVFVSVFVFALGLRPWTSCLSSGVIMTVLVYGMFRIIGIELPPGVLPF